MSTKYKLSTCFRCNSKIGGDIKDGTHHLRREYPKYALKPYEDMVLCDKCAQEYIVERKSREVFKPFFDGFSKQVNVLGYEYDTSNIEAAVDGFIRQHRTLQGSMLNFTRLFLRKIGGLAQQEPARYTDARNENALEWAMQAGSLDWNQPFI